MLPELEKYMALDWKWRICLRPDPWNKLWELLPDRKRVGNGWEPALPLILAAWYETQINKNESVLWSILHGLKLMGLGRLSWNT